MEVGGMRRAVVAFAAVVAEIAAARRDVRVVCRRWRGERAAKDERGYAKSHLWLLICALRSNQK